MKYFLIALAFYCQTSFAQVDSLTYIQELEWKIYLPSGFKIVDTAILNAEYRSLSKTWIKPQDSSFNRPVFTARDSNNNSISVYYVDSVHDVLNGDFADDAYSGIITIKKTKSTIIYDRVAFNKLQIHGTPRPGYSYTAVMLKTRFRSKTFDIDYAYTDRNAGKEIEKMLSTSKFER